MSKKTGIIGIIIALLFGGGATFGAITNTPSYNEANTSSAVTCGPDFNTQVVSTTSARTYLHLQNNGVTDIYVEAQADAPATANEGILLSSTSTGYVNSYEFSAEKGNRLAGAVRCTATASTTLLVTEFID